MIWQAFRNPALGAVIAIQVAAFGCASKPAGAPVMITPSGEIVAQAAAPSRAETAGPAPVADAVWIAGYWAYMNQNWVWIPGHWEKPPDPSAVWVPGHWEQTLRGWEWTPGRWSVSDTESE